MLGSGTTEIVLPVRFVAEGHAVQCTTRQLGVGAVLVSCASPPRPGTPLALRIYLPGEPTPQELRALVRVPLVAGAFWADFHEGQDDAKARIAALLARVAEERLHHPGRAGAADTRPQHSIPTPAMTPRLTPMQMPRVPPALATPEAGLPRALADAGLSPPSLAAGASDEWANRRTHRRLETPPLPVRFATVEDFVLEYAANISAGGIFIKTSTPPPLETKVRVRLELPDGGPALETEGVVLHRLDARQAGTLRAPGAGVQFVHPTPEFTARIEKFLDKVLSRGGLRMT